MVEDEEITGTMRGDSDNDLVSEFIGKFVIFHVTSKNKDLLHNVISIYYLFSTL